MSTKLLQTTFFLVIYYYSLGFARLCSSVSSDFSSGSGSTNMLPLQAFSELWDGTLFRYVPSFTTILAN